ncbi:MAG: hypothetical protein KF901_11535 [Myxococcales bacterium]|nr:hypothetical protein [Myxococcales bacterium]
MPQSGSFVFGVLLSLVTLGYAGVAFALHPLAPDVAAVVLYLALGFGVAALAYLALGPGLFGKREDGSRAVWGYVVAGPFFVAVALARLLQRAITREAPWDEVAPDLYVGRPVTLAALPERAATVVDLTAELLEAREVRDACHYVCLPVLDGTAPSPEALAELARRALASPAPHYVHCAAGHGRSAMLAAVLLVARGEASDVGDAERLMKRARPRVRLTRAQAECARRALAHLSIG